MQPNHKCSFILRLWRDDKSEAAEWRASIEIPKTATRVGFASLEQLFAFLIDFTDVNCSSMPAAESREENSDEEKISQ